MIAPVAPALSPSALVRSLGMSPLSPEDLAERVADEYGYYGEFRRLVEEYLPDRLAEVMGARGPDGERETARVAAFVSAFTREYFPIHEPFEYAGLVHGIPYYRLGWEAEQLHDVGRPGGRLLLRALCSHEGWGDDTRLPALDALSEYVPDELLARIPDGGVGREQLHRLLDGTRLEPAALFGDWLAGATGTPFLDINYEDGIPDDEWDRDCVLWGVEEWPKAMALLDRIEVFERWLEQDPRARFAELLGAALGGAPADVS